MEFVGTTADAPDTGRAALMRAVLFPRRALVVVDAVVKRIVCMRVAERSVGEEQIAEIAPVNDAVVGDLSASE